MFFFFMPRSARKPSPTVPRSFVFLRGSAVFQLKYFSQMCAPTVTMSPQGQVPYCACCTYKCAVWYKQVSICNMYVESVYSLDPGRPSASHGCGVLLVVVPSCSRSYFDGDDLGDVIEDGQDMQSLLGGVDWGPNTLAGVAPWPNQRRRREL